MKPSCQAVLRMIRKRWTSNYDLVTQCSLSALSRVRELRQMGYRVDVKRQVDRKGRFTNTYLYRARWSR